MKIHFFNLKDSGKKVATFFWADDEGLLGYLHYFHSIILPLIDKGVGYIGETHSTIRLNFRRHDHERHD